MKGIAATLCTGLLMLPCSAESILGLLLPNTELARVADQTARLLPFWNRNWDNAAWFKTKKGKGDSR